MLPLCASPSAPLIWRATFQSVALIHSRQPKRSVSQCARPMWSGCMCVQITRSTGRPCSSCAKMSSHAARVAALSMPQSTIAQPSREPSAVTSTSRSSHRLMWSSANGSGMRSQRTPSATGRVLPMAGSWSPKT